jgi:hypothetical protein
VAIVEILKPTLRTREYIEKGEQDGKTLPSGSVTIHAMIRQRNAFRYGFEFIDPDFMHEFIRRTCRDLAVEVGLKACNTELAHYRS